MITKEFTTEEQFSSLGRAVTLWESQRGPGHNLGPLSGMLPSGVELGKGSRVRVTVEVLEDRPASLNPYRCPECQDALSHTMECSRPDWRN